MSSSNLAKTLKAENQIAMPPKRAGPVKACGPSSEKAKPAACGRNRQHRKSDNHACIVNILSGSGEAALN